MTVVGEVGKKLRKGVFFAGFGLPRDTDGIKCVACGKGYAEQVDCTPEECSEYGCGRDTPTYQCCACAFVCAACGARNVGMREAPDY